jgi:hypothetical protein
MALKTLYIRIHPLSKGGRGGHRVQQYFIYGSLFRVSQGWYRCSFSEEQWAYLRDVRTKNVDPESKLVFDICTEQERLEIEVRERQEKITEVAPVGEPVDLTTGDLPKSKSAEDGPVDLAPPAEPSPRRRGRPRKVVTTTEG